VLEVTPDNALDYLRSLGRLPPGPARAEALSGGVSNIVLRVETAAGRFVLKQSRPRLRTRDDWFSDLERVYREQEVMQALRPLLPEGVVPAVLFADRPNYAFAMSHAPQGARVWKEALLAGETDARVAEFAGTVLGRMHQATAADRSLVEPFRDHAVFVQLRVDPYYRRVRERCPDVAAHVGPLIDQLLSVQEALCHADFSPKNMLVRGGCFTLVDYETAHLGDPTMDLGFFLSHLMLKAVKRSAERERYFELTRAFWRGYGREVRFRPLGELQARGIGHFALCVRARIDGTSPVDYLHDEARREAARELSRRVFRERVRGWEDVLRVAGSVLGE
jgi:5-methylthioribose kinase